MIKPGSGRHFQILSQTARTSTQGAAYIRSRLGIWLLLLICAALTPPRAWGQSDTQTRQAFLAHQQQIIEQELAGHQRAAQQAKQALQAGRQALADANSQGNTEAASISQQAIDIAQRTLNNAQRLSTTDQSRLHAVQNAMRWKHVEKAYGIPALIQGQVMVRSGGRLQPLGPDAPIKPGQELVTGPDSSFEVITNTGARVDVGPNSEFIYLTNQNSDSELLNGLLHVTESALGGPTEMNIYTRDANTGVRGTKFVVDISNDIERFYLLAGSMDVWLRKNHQTVSLKPGQMIAVDRQGFVGKPQSFDVATLPTWRTSE